jgi:hypothetical protein
MYIWALKSPGAAGQKEMVIVHVESDVVSSGQDTKEKLNAESPTTVMFPVSNPYRWQERAWKEYLNVSLPPTRVGAKSSAATNGAHSGGGFVGLSVEPAVEVAAGEAGAEAEAETEAEVTVGTDVVTGVVDAGAVVLSVEATVGADVVDVVVGPTGAAWGWSSVSSAVNAIVPAIATAIASTQMAGLATTVRKLPRSGTACGATAATSGALAAVVVTSAVCEGLTGSVTGLRVCRRAVASWVK